MKPSSTTKSIDPQAFDRQQALDRLEKLGRWLDSSIRVPGTNFMIGWDAIIGLVPGFGDAASAALSGWIVWQAKRLGASKWVLTKMIANIGIDTTVGAVPLAGDFFDAAYKSNKKNIALLRRHLEKQEMARRRTGSSSVDVQPRNREASTLSE